MTLPYQEVNSITQTHRFLADLIANEWNVPTEVRRHARDLLKHYPSNWSIAERYARELRAERDYLNREWLEELLG